MPGQPDRSEESTIGFTTAWSALPGGPERSSYLLIVDGTRSSIFPLPLSGEVIVGRGAEATLRLQESTASRRHVRLCMERGIATISDMDSQNGTRVNGKVLSTPCILLPHDVIAIGEATLIYHGEAPSPVRRSPCSEAEL